MDSENVISWNFANFVTIGLMLAIIWSALGIVSHLVRKPNKMKGSTAVQTTGNFSDA